MPPSRCQPPPEGLPSPTRRGRRRRYVTPAGGCGRRRRVPPWDSPPCCPRDCSALPSRNRGPGAGGERGLARRCAPFPAMGMGSASRIPRSPSRRYARPQPACNPGGFPAPGGSRSVAGRCWRLAAGSRRAPRCARGRLPEKPGRSHLARTRQMLRSQQQSFDRRRRCCCFMRSFRSTGPLLWRPMRRDNLPFLFFLYFFFP